MTFDPKQIRPILINGSRITELVSVKGVQYANIVTKDGPRTVRV